MPKGWFPGTSSDSSWTKSVPWPSPKRSAPNLHLPPFCTSHSEAVRVSRRLPRTCDNASSWGCQCMDLQGQNIPPKSVRCQFHERIQNFNLPDWSAFGGRFDKEGKPCRSKVCNSSRKLCLQQPPTAQVNQGTVRKQNIQMISLLKVWFQRSLRGRLPPNMLHLVATNALTHLHSMGMVQEDQVPSATFNQIGGGNKDAPSSIETSTTADPLEFDVKCHSPSTVANFLPFLHPLLSSHSPRTDPGFVGFIHIFQLKLQTPKFDPMDIMRSMFLERSSWRQVLRFLWSLISEKQKSLFSAFQQWPVDVNQHNPAPKCVEMHTNY